jgi:ADP-ribose pyrophosphatase
VNGKFLIFRQTKYAVEGDSLAPVGGMLEPGEEPLAAARRELLEEMGCEASEWVPLGSYTLDPNRGVASMHLFMALNAVKVAEPIIDDLEEQELLMLERGELEKALAAGEFKVLAWATVVSMALNRLKE